MFDRITTGILLLAVLLGSTSTPAQELQVPWSNSGTGASGSPSTSVSDAADTHSAYYPGTSGIHDPRFYDSRTTFMGVPVPTGMAVSDPSLVRPNFPSTQGRDGISVLNPGLERKFSLVVDLWNVFTGETSLMKGLGSILTTAVNARVYGISGRMNPNVSLDQHYMQMATRNQGQVTVPSQFHDCEGCDRVHPLNPDADVGKIFRRAFGRDASGTDT